MYLQKVTIFIREVNSNYYWSSVIKGDAVDIFEDNIAKFSLRFVHEVEEEIISLMVYELWVPTVIRF